MKKLFLAVVAVVMAANVSAKQGDMVLSGNVGFNMSSSKDDDGNKGPSYTSYEIAPSFTYFVSNKWGIGGQIGYVGTSTKYEGTPAFTEGLFTIEPFARYYFFNNNKIGIFAQAGLQFGFGSDTGDNSITTIDLGIKPGIQYFISKKLSVELSLGNILGFAYTKVENLGSESEFGLFVNNARTGNYVQMNNELPNPVSGDVEPVKFQSNPYSINYAPLTFTLNYHF